MNYYLNLIIPVALILLAGMSIVSQTQRGLIEQLGKYHSIETQLQ